MTRPPTRAELAQKIIRLPLDDQRVRLEELYWALVAEECGAEKAKWWRDELDWLRKNR